MPGEQFFISFTGINIVPEQDDQIYNKEYNIECLEDVNGIGVLCGEQNAGGIKIEIETADEVEYETDEEEESEEQEMFFIEEDMLVIGEIDGGVDGQIEVESEGEEQDGLKGGEEKAERVREEVGDRDQRVVEPD